MTKMFYLAVFLLMTITPLCGMIKKTNLSDCNDESLSLISEYNNEKKHKKKYDLTNNKARKLLIPTKNNSGFSDIGKFYPSNGSLFMDKNGDPSICFYNNNTIVTKNKDKNPICKYWLVNTNISLGSVYQKAEESAFLNKTAPFVYGDRHKGSIISKNYYQYCCDSNKNKRSPFFVSSSKNGDVFGIVRSFPIDLNKIYNRELVSIYMKKELISRFFSGCNEWEKYYKSVISYDQELKEDDFIEVIYAGNVPKNIDITAFSVSQSGRNMLISVEEKNNSSLLCIKTDKIISLEKVKECNNLKKQNISLGQRAVGYMYSEDKRENNLYGVPFATFSEKTQSNFISLASLGKRNKTSNDEYLGVDSKGALCFIEISPDNKINIKEASMNGYSFEKVNVNQDNFGEIVLVVERESNKERAICCMRFNEKTNKYEVIKVRIIIGDVPKYIGFDNNDIIYVKGNDNINDSSMIVERIEKLILYVSGIRSVWHPIEF